MLGITRANRGYGKMGVLRKKRGISIVFVSALVRNLSHLCLIL